MRVVGYIGENSEDNNMAGENTMLEDVKKALGIEGTYQDNTIQEYINDVVGFLQDAGIKSGNITSGLVARGVSDLWNYGASNGKLSEYFMQRATQLSYKA